MRQAQLVEPVLGDMHGDVNLRGHRLGPDRRSTRQRQVDVLLGELGQLTEERRVALVFGQPRAEIGDRANASSAMSNSSRKSPRVTLTIIMMSTESQLV